MKILFVSSGNSKQGISPIVKAQGDSLQEAGIEINYFTVVGRGAWGYYQNVPHLRKHLKTNNYDIVHAHYSLTGMVAALARAHPLVVSLMGSDIKGTMSKRLIKVFNKLFWRACIVKSKGMKTELGIEDVLILPNGVDMTIFKPLGKLESISYLGWNPDKTHILFAANPKRPEKNVALADAAYQLIKRDNTELHYLIDVAHQDMPYYYNASDVVVLTSKSEGSPNVIKEAMACDSKIVSTDVGDVRERFQNSPFCFIAENNAEDFADKLRLALGIKEPAQTRDLVMNLDAKYIANQLVELYKSIVK